MQSETIAKLAEALAKAQAQMSGAAKGKVNPHFKSKYADLAAVWDACREPLAKHGLCVSQTFSFSTDGVMILDTRLMHSSGEWLMSTYPIHPIQATPQGVGSAITYARRYSLAAIAGVAPEDEDDDGNAASRGDVSPPPRPASRQAPVSDLPEWKRDAESILAKIRASTVPEVVTELMDNYEETLETIREHSKTAYDFLITAANGKKMELMKAQEAAE